ncbi:MAG: hypothetical protein ACREDL_24385, partial [Bradyrhizobium sp.]
AAPRSTQTHAKSGLALVATPTQTAHTTKQNPAPLSSNPTHRRNEALVTRRDSLQTQVGALAAQVARQTAHLDQLRTEIGQAAQRLAVLPEIDARIAWETSTLSMLQNPVKQAKQKLALARASRAPAATALVRTTVAPSALAPKAIYSAARSRDQQSIRERARLLAARADLSEGNSADARQLIEAVQTQLILQPVTPDNPMPDTGGNVSAELLGQTIRLLDAGQKLPALHVLDRVIAELGSRLESTSYAQATGSR